MEEAVCYKIDRNGTKYYHNKGICPKCGGHKYISYYSYNEGGRCFLCGGTGVYLEKWKEYTPEYQAKLDARRLEKEKAVAPANNKYLFERNGLNEEGTCYVVLGNTYEIKDQLKAQGARYTQELGWHFKEERENTIKVTIDEIATKNEAGQYYLKDWYIIKEYLKLKKEGK